MQTVLLRSLSVKGCRGEGGPRACSLGMTVEEERPGVLERAQTKRSKVF